MALDISNQAPSLLVRREAYERVGLSRLAIDERLGLTQDEFRVEGGLVIIGPIYDEDALDRLVQHLEELGLRHFDDFFDMSGNWPDWLKLLGAVQL